MESTIRSDDAMVSRNHARIVLASGGWVIEDLGSSNGLYYQERRVARHQLKHGDAVRCGSLWIRFVDPARGQLSSAGFQPVPTNDPPIGASSGDPTHGIAPVNVSAASSSGSGDGDDIAFLRRRVEQLKSELRLVRGGGPGAKRTEDLEDELTRTNEENNKLKDRITALEAQIVAEGGDAQVVRAGKIAATAGEVVIGLNDVLSNLRINVMAAEGEFEQFHSAIPRASYELILEALRSSGQDMESARELLRRLRQLAGV